MISRLWSRAPAPRCLPLHITSCSPNPRHFYRIDSTTEDKPPIKFLRPLLIVAMAVLTLILIVLFAFHSHVHSILIPAPDSGHQFKSAVAEFSLVDTKRKDPHTVDEDRKIMVSLFMPIPVSDCTNEYNHAYMGKVAAKIANNQTLGDPNNGIFEKMQYTVCGGSSKPIDASNIPVVVLEPHTDTSRLLYSNLARYMTANNVAVVLIDHPHDSSVVEFSDTDVVYNSGATGLSNFSPLTAWNSTVTNAIDIRVQDIYMALDKLEDVDLLTRNFGSNFNFSSGLNTTSYSITGHGLGGTVATQLGTSDRRVRLSINLSGSAPPLDHNTASEIYFLGRSDFLRDDDINWPQTWKHLTGPSTEFDLADSGILDFTDLPIVIETSGQPSVKGFGLGNSGPWGNHAVKCFVEGILRDQIHGETGAVSYCIQLFGDRMVPYMAKDAGVAVQFRAKESSAASRPMPFGTSLRRVLRNWAS